MDFYINKNSTLPILKMDVIIDGKNDYSRFYEFLEKSDSVTFSMTNIENGIPRIINSTAYILPKIDECNCIYDEYYIAYQFSKRDTSKEGLYRGFFTINSEGQTLIAPITEDLIIHIK